jgi:hypothetical protein
MITAQHRGHCFLILKAGAPHQRAIAENPITIAFSHRIGLSASPATIMPTAHMIWSRTTIAMILPDVLWAAA